MFQFPLLALVAIAIGAVGDAVRNLHALLIRLDFSPPPEDEMETGTYGRGTEEIVSRLQARLHLNPPRLGEVDEETAREANRHAFDLHVFSVVRGSVVDAEGVPVSGAIVRIQDADNLDGLACAEVRTAENGALEAYYDPAFYQEPRLGVVRPKDAVDVVARVVDAAGKELVRSKVFPAPARELRIDLRLPPVDAAPEDVKTLRVRGFVVDLDGAALPGIRVDIFDRDIGPDLEPLGSDPTRDDPVGYFEVSYELARFDSGDAPTRGKVKADLIFALSRDDKPLDDFDILRLPVDGDETIVDTLPVPADEKILGVVARDDELVQLRVRGIQAPRGPSQYETLMKALEPLTARTHWRISTRPGRAMRALPRGRSRSSGSWSPIWSPPTSWRGRPSTARPRRHSTASPGCSGHGSRA